MDDYEWAFLVSAQAGIVTHSQAVRVGFSEHQIEHKLVSGRWRRVHWGIYATFTGEPSWEARLWAALLWAGKGAALSHQTAAELYEFADRRERAIHVTVPAARRPQSQPLRGVIIHRSDQGSRVGVAPWKFPRTSAADTVLDLVTAAGTVEDAYSWVSRAVAPKKVSVAELREALARRKRFPGRAWLADALADVGDGAHFPLERRYARDVERAHGLPQGVRQARRVIDGREHRKDIWYEKYGVCVEVDGVAYHRDRQHQDRHRDNVNLAVDDVRTFRFDIVDLTEGACRSAVMIAATLSRNGWNARPHPCARPACPLRNP